MFPPKKLARKGSKDLSWTMEMLSFRTTMLMEHDDVRVWGHFLITDPLCGGSPS